MAEPAEFVWGVAPGGLADSWHAPAPALDASAVNAEVNIISGDARDGRITLTVRDPSIDRVRIRPGDGVIIDGVTLDGLTYADEPIRSLRCDGRSCRDWVVELDVQSQSDSPVIKLDLYRYGLGSDGQGLLAARPDWAMPQHTGDVQLIRRELPLR